MVTKVKKKFNFLFFSFLLLFPVLFSGCATMATVPQNEYYANKLAATESFAKDSEYLRKEYAGTTKYEAYWAYNAILSATLLDASYDRIILEINSINKENKKSLIYTMKETEDVFIAHLGYYSAVWSEAIESRTFYENYSYHLKVDFSTALAIVKKEYSRIGVFSKIDIIKEKILQLLEP